MEYFTITLNANQKYYMDAIIDCAKRVGWKHQESISHGNNLCFNISETKTFDLKPKHFWKCDQIGNEKKNNYVVNNNDDYYNVLALLITEFNHCSEKKIIDL